MSNPLPAGSTVGIVGGGQLGRMLAMAAARLNLRTVILEPQADCPAAQVANGQIVAAYDDPQALADAALSLLTDAGAWQAASQAGIARVEKYYTDDLMFGHYRRVYDAALTKADA